jgi:hypothetical protein
MLYPDATKRDGLSFEDNRVLEIFAEVHAPMSRIYSLIE